AGPCSKPTFAQSTSSSSATIIGSDVSTPCPISDWPTVIVTLPSFAILINAFGWKSAAGVAGILNRSSARVGTATSKTRAPPATIVAFKNERRSMSVLCVILFTSVHRGCLDGGAYAIVSAAAADNSGHRLVDIGVGRLW